jgi:hypothetical protein
MPQKSPWNKGKSVGQKAPFRPRDVQTIKQILENAGNLRDLALFSVGINTMLRGVDLLALRVEDEPCLGLQALAPVNLLLAGPHKKHCKSLESVLPMKTAR